MTSLDRQRQKQRLFELQHGECYACDSRCRFDGLTRHHVILRFCNGSDDDGNIVLICNECNALAHHPELGARFDRNRHRVLNRIFVKNGFTAPQRNRLYTSYQRFGSGPKSQGEVFRATHFRLTKNDYARWQDDGGM